MKKIYSFITALLISSVSFAQGQQLSMTPTDVMHTTKKMSFDAQKFSKNKNQANKTATTLSGWFCSGAEFNTLLSDASVLKTYPFFPDTMGKFTFSNGNFATFVHALGEVLDPKGMQFSSSASTDFIVNPTPQTYFLDSMSIVYGYERNHANVNIVDTLIITVANNNTATNLGGGYYPASTATFVTNYATDTLQLHRPKYTYTTQNLNAVGSYKFKIPLTLADTAVTFLNEKYFKLPAAFNVPMNKVLIASVVFKPGYSYVEGDVISTMGNTFYFASYEENGANTYPMYQDCNFNSPACEYGNSSIVNSSVRYNVNASGFNGSFLPSYVFSQAYGFEHHLISFRLNAGSVGVNELGKVENGVALGQNIPNPFTKESMVTYNLVKNASSAIFTVTDVMGRIISSEKVGTTTGNHSIKLGTYAAGLYYYSLNVDGNVSTKKMIVE